MNSYASPENLRRTATADMATIGVGKPSRDDAEAAVRTLLRWTGDDPMREGLLGTPDRVVRAYEEFFAGYGADPIDMLSRTFEETDGYDEMVLLREINFQSHCEHHMVPIIGVSHVAYIPQNRVVGISKLARIVIAFAKRLQIQERLTMQIANTIMGVLQPRGVAVTIDAIHECMTSRGIKKEKTTTITNYFLGAFKGDLGFQNRYLRYINKN